MPLSMQNLATARDIVQNLLEYLDVDAYVFDVEPGENAWMIHLECGAEDGWHTRVIEVAPARLANTESDVGERERLVQEWDRILSDCQRRHAQPI